MTSLNNARKLPFERATEEETKLFSKLVIAQLEKGKESV
jgi:hypothetical protein